MNTVNSSISPEELEGLSENGALLKNGPSSSVKGEVRLMLSAFKNTTSPEPVLVIVPSNVIVSPAPLCCVGKSSERVSGSGSAFVAAPSARKLATARNNPAKLFMFFIFPSIIHAVFLSLRFLWLKEVSRVGRLQRFLRSKFRRNPQPRVHRPRLRWPGS